jgi:hypothetical protein
MVYKLGRFLQFVGLFVLIPLALAGNMFDERLNLKEMLFLSVAGMLVFFVGWLLQESARKN